MTEPQKNQANANKKRSMIIAGVIALVVLFAGVTFASASSLPGNPLFPLRKSIENSGFMFKNTPLQKADYHLELAGRRLDDLRILVRRDNENGIGMAITEYENHSLAVRSLFDDVKRSDADDVKEDLFALNDEYIEIISDDGSEGADISDPSTSLDDPTTDTSEDDLSTSTTDDDGDEDHGDDDDVDDDDDSTTGTTEDDHGDDDDDEDDDRSSSTSLPNTSTTEDDDDDDDDSSSSSTTLDDDDDDDDDNDDEDDDDDDEDDDDDDEDDD